MKYSEIKLNEIESRQYDRQTRFGTDWIVEHTFITNQNLTEDETKTIFKKHDSTVSKFHKVLLTFANGIQLYKYVGESIQY